MELAELEVGLAAYIDNEIVPAMSGAPTYKKIGIAAVIAQAKSSGFIDKYFNAMVNDPMFVALGVVTEDGKIGDIDTICDSLKSALDSHGSVEIPFFDVKVDASDVDVLRKYLNGSSASPSPLRGRKSHAQT